MNLYNDKKYAEAAKAFEKVSAAEPYNRDALFNLANTYLAMKDGAKLLAVAQRLAAIEPLNETTLKLVGEGYKQTSKVDDAVKTAEKVLALPVDVKVTGFTPSGKGAALDRDGDRPRRPDRRRQADPSGGRRPYGGVPRREGHRSREPGRRRCRRSRPARRRSSRRRDRGRASPAWRYKRSEPERVIARKEPLMAGVQAEKMPAGADHDARRRSSSRRSRRGGCISISPTSCTPRPTTKRGTGSSPAWRAGGGGTPIRGFCRGSRTSVSIPTGCRGWRT